ncbi:MAG: hypothetical protein LBH05_05710 [Deferribacteraceae bacterium]|jgi:flagellar motility protein MotE (MotC chaperone)|nr:hypothetical protein [Deferribacteraceae bacterium]
MYNKIIITVLIALTATYVCAQTGFSADNVNLVDIQEATKKIREKERELLEREQIINAREDSLKVMEQDIISREEDLKKIRQEITARMDQIDAGSKEDLDKLAKIYSSTKAKSAASILIKMDPEKAAAILRKITPMNSGRIMAEIGKQDPDYASRLTVSLSGDKAKNMAPVDIQ